MRRSHADQRYLDDAKFKALVDTLEAMTAHGEFTPTEVREALLLAQLRYEMANPRAITFSPDLQRQIDFMSIKRK